MVTSTSSVPAQPGHSAASAALALLATPGLRASDLRLLLDALGSAEAVCAAGTASWRSAGVVRCSPAQLPSPSSSAIARQCRVLRQCETQIIAWGDERYPPVLTHIHSPPPFLFVRGDARCLQSNAVAIVGARLASGYGVSVAARLAADLCAANCTVVSGLALGVDGAAHEGALHAHGRTVAVMACGPERVYPRAHARLASRILERGALVTEFPPGVPPRPDHFPRRNRIIAGLSLGVVVVEARLRSGSLITARLALEQGREVFAVPGAITSMHSEGCHQLLKDGAQLTQNAADILRELEPQFAWGGSANAGGGAGSMLADPLRGGGPDAGDGASLLRTLAAEPCSMELLIERCGLPASTVLRELQRLELSGKVLRAADGSWSLRRV